MECPICNTPVSPFGCPNPQCPSRHFDAKCPVCNESPVDIKSLERELFLYTCEAGHEWVSN